MKPNHQESKERKSEQFFRDFGIRLDEFMLEVKDASSRVETDLKMRFEELKQAGESFRKEERWKEVEASLKKAGTELENAFKAAFRKKAP